MDFYISRLEKNLQNRQVLVCNAVDTGKIVVSQEKIHFETDELKELLELLFATKNRWSNNDVK